MTKPKVLVLRAAGTNCDLEMVQAFELAGALPEKLHVNRLIENAKALDEYQILAIPGGFTYGDDVAAGKVLAVELRHRLGEALSRFVAADRLLIGICNGFQVLIKTGLLPGGEGSDGSLATLTNNDSGKFEDRWINLNVERTNCAFTSELAPGARLFFPIAHGEGKFVTSGEKVLARLKRGGQVVLRYVAGVAQPPSAGLAGSAQAGAPVPHEPAYPENPNGSEDAIAGICDPSGRILGLMPHPERHLTPYLHPSWTRRTEQPEEGDGLAIFRSAVEYFG